jgi:ribosomal protein S3
MLSVDQFLRLVSLPAVVTAFLIASQISGGVSFRPALLQVVSK